MTQKEWIVSGDTGTSSKAMWAAINGVERALLYADCPHDVSDFGRCYRYYVKCRLTNDDLQKVKSAIPWFAPFIDNWGALEELYLSEMGQPRAPKTYDLIKQLRKESDLIKCKQQ